MGKSDNLLINEEELLDACKTISNYSKDIDQRVRTYSKIMESIKEDSIIFGDVATTLNVYNQMVILLHNQSTLISQSLTKIIKNFLQEVDNDDKYIY